MSKTKTPEEELAKLFHKFMKKCNPRKIFPSYKGIYYIKKRNPKDCYAYRIPDDMVDFFEQVCGILNYDKAPPENCLNCFYLFLSCFEDGNACNHPDVKTSKVSRRFNLKNVMDSRRPECPLSTNFKETTK